MVGSARSRRTGAQQLFTTLLALVMAVSLVGLNVVGVRASTITVTNANDSGSGSLRQAIIDAVAGDTITFSALFNTPQTISFTASSEMAISKNLTITGPGSANLTIDAGNFSRIFNISGGSNTVSISGMTLTKGKVLVAGGAILNSSLLTLDDVIVTANQASGLGGGIASTGGTVTIKNSTVSNNTAGLGTGGVGNIGTLTIQNSTISGNTTQGGNGGGINNIGTVTITGSTISGNTANGTTANGGGISVAGALTITTSTISGNSTTGSTVTNGNGGGISQTGGALIIKRSTISGNNASTATNATGGGGGISTLNLPNTSVIANSTISGNGAKVGGGIAVNGALGTGTLTVQNTTIVGNTVTTANSGGGIRVVGTAGTANLNIGNTILSNTNGNIVKSTSLGGAANVTSQSGNVASDAAGLANSLNSTDPLLDATGLQSNGGPTKTVVLQVTSPALGYGIAGTCSNANVSSVDQRSITRPQGTNCDAGATESRATTLVSADAEGPAGGTMTLQATLTDTSGTPVALSGQTIIFTLNGTQVCNNPGGGYATPCPTTDSNGLAELTGVVIPTAPTGLITDAIEASFSGATDYLPSTGTSDLRVLIPTTINKVALTGTYGSTEGTLTATLKQTYGNYPIANAKIKFKVNGVAVCGGALPACPKTNAKGVATLGGQTVPLRDAGTYSDYVIEAIFAGDDLFLPSTGEGNLQIERMILLVKPVDQTVKLKQPNPIGCTLQLVSGYQFVAGDDWSDINLTYLRCTNTRNYPNSNASETIGKTYKISATGVSSKNYDIRYQLGTLTVVP